MPYDITCKYLSWTRNGVPTIEKIKALGLDWIPELVKIINEYEGTKPPEDTLPESDDWN